MCKESSALKIEDLDKDMKTNNLDSLLGIRWHSPKQAPFRVSGFYWFNEDKIYRRLPLKAQEKIPSSVNFLSANTSGGQIAFQTNSTKLSIRVVLDEVVSVFHIPATGHSGFDCFLGMPGDQQYYNVTKFEPQKAEYECLLFSMNKKELRNVTLNFPLYNGVKEVFVGLDEDAEILPPPPFRTENPIVFYGTSITQGACASRPGMSFTNILSKRFNTECINLGFSGNGFGEPELAEVICEIREPSCIILDYEGNASSRGLLETTLSNFIEILRETHQDVPILVISQVPFAKERYDKEMYNKRQYYKAFQRDTVASFKARGDENIYFCDGESFFGDIVCDCSVDGIHPNDLGFMKIADTLEPVLKDILGI